MAKKKDEKDVLVVRDEKTGEISVVAGLNADGTPKRTPAKAENAQSFLQFDRHGDVLDNFFKNFFRQCKEPSRFGFYRIAADQAENLLEVMKQLLKDPEANKELLAPHKVDTSDYEKKVQEEMAAQQTEKQDIDIEHYPEEDKQGEYDEIFHRFRVGFLIIIALVFSENKRLIGIPESLREHHHHHGDLEASPYIPNCSFAYSLSSNKNGNRILSAVWLQIPHLKDIVHIKSWARTNMCLLQTNLKKAVTLCKKPPI